MVVFSLFTEAPAAMSCRRGLVLWQASMAAADYFSVPFLLIGNQRLASPNAEHFDEVKGPKNQGRHHGPTALGNRPSSMSAGPTHPTRSVFGVPAHGVRCSHLRSKRHTPTPRPHGGQGSAIPYTARGLNPRRRFAPPPFKGVPEGRGIKRHEAIHL